MGFRGPTGLDMGVFVPVIQARGFDLALSMDLLGTIEQAMLAENDNDE